MDLVAVRWVMSGADDRTEIGRALERALCKLRLRYAEVAYDEITFGITGVRVPFELWPGVTLSQVRRYRKDIACEMGLEANIDVHDDPGRAGYACVWIPRDDAQSVDVADLPAPEPDLDYHRLLLRP